MLSLAVTTKAETFERMEAPLLERGIEVTHLQVDERTVGLSPDSSPWSPSTYDVGYVYPSRLMEGAVAEASLDIPWVNDKDAILRSRNKAGILAQTAAAGLPTPPSQLVSNPVEEAELVDIFSSLGGDVVIKPNSTTRGVGVARATDLDTFLGIVDYLELVHAFPATGDRSYVVQSFIPNARDIRVMVLDGTYIGAVERHNQSAHGTDRWKHNVHRGATAAGIDLDAELQALAESVADLVGIPILGVDLLVADDAVYVSETNARPTIDTVSKYQPGFWDELARVIKRRAP